MSQIRRLLILGALLLGLATSPPRPVQAGHALSECEAACKGYAHQMYDACITAGGKTSDCYNLLIKTYHECVKTNCR